MKKIIQIVSYCLVLFTVLSCQDDDSTLEQVLVPQNLEVTTDITTDGSGNVTFTATADNAVTYRFSFPDGSTVVAPAGVYTKRFTKTGLNSYQVTVLAYGQAGVSSSKLVEVSVESDFSDPDAIELLTGGGSKTWYWAADVPNHLGVGPNNNDPNQNYFWAFFSFTEPFALADIPSASCAYDDEFIFSTSNGENLTYVYDNKGASFFNRTYASVVGGQSPDDSCYEFDTTGENAVTLAPSESVVAAERKRGTVMTLGDNGFVGYYIGTNEYEIMSLTENRMVLRAVQGNDQGLAWYVILTSQKPVRGATGPVAETDTFPNLLWSDEFDVDGAPNPLNWTYDIGNGQVGWGNNELQYYTDRADNVSVADGVLNITAKRENFMGQEFTSARLKSEGLQEFTFGRVEVRAKLPEGVGTWPAIWMLGADYQTNPWPGTGEIDIMEHVGRNQNEVLSTLHFPGNSGANGISQSTIVNDVAGTFHVYAAEWTETQIRFYVDDELYHLFENDSQKPFDKDFFMILNVAMGGNLGGDVDPAFTQSSMQVDYVRIYQRD
ncbi:family 16 glycosylhydrolase [Leeuwenhoekiella sp. MAR_2009_132]|uniref:family 16 glycosylhydrolase n=1 Tax=Leeuwenhoekiella sp. MAR_2009_132 TaxID=1392489 RepID=UPI00048AB0A7|nr:family 16 glycosylhydrolase [Leeuwenhoekiella sp. MAR_2009_132]